MIHRTSDRKFDGFAIIFSWFVAVGGDGGDGGGGGGGGGGGSSIRCL